MTNQEVALRRWNDRLERFFSNQQEPLRLEVKKVQPEQRTIQLTVTTKSGRPLEESERWAKFMKTNLFTR